MSNIPGKKRGSSGFKGGDNFRVVVRVRPLPEKVHVAQCLLIDEEQKLVTITKPEKKKQIDIESFREIVVADNSQVHHFVFDEVFGPSAAQSAIFQGCVQPIVESVLEGYNGSVIASGQTGSGKTFTIEGGGGDYQKGIVPRVTEQIFGYIQNSATATDRFLVRISFLEIYNEKISDLLDHKQDNLKLRDDGLGGVYVESLSEHVVRNTDEALQLLKAGSLQRTTSATRNNKESSRSHAVFTIIVEHAQYDTAGGSVVTIGKMRMVDLAGSERLDIEAQFKQQEETKSINVSLHTFGKVVTALTTPGGRHVPYRESKLTRILQDSLGGNCKTTLIATINPMTICYTESLNTLNFAKRAKNIKNNATVNKDVSHKALLSAYELEIKKLRDELQQRDTTVDKEQIARLAQECQEAQIEKNQVLEKLEAQQRRTSEIEAEKNVMTKKILELENAVLHRGSTAATDSEEFKRAVEKEQERIRKETESRLENKLAELDQEKKKLQEERAEIQKQKELLDRVKAGLVPDAIRGDDTSADYLRMNVLTLTPSHSAVRKPNSATSVRTWAVRCPPPSDVPNMRPPTGRRISSVESLNLSSLQNSKFPHKLSIQPPTVDLEQPMQQSISFNGFPGQEALHEDPNKQVLMQYSHALADPQTGIPCQEFQTGLKVFNGYDAAKWLMSHVQGVATIEAAQDIGQKLLDYGIFAEIQGNDLFQPLEDHYYQFSDGTLTQNASLPISYNRSPNSLYSGSSNSIFTLRTSQNMATSMSSIATDVVAPPTGDPYTTFKLSQYAPTPLHLAALYGRKSEIKTFVSQDYPVDSVDSASHTPLMYAVLGYQAKACLQLLNFGANVNATNSNGDTALSLALTNEYHSIVKLLLKNNVQIQFRNETAFHLAARLPNSKCLQYLFKYIAVDDLQNMNKRNGHYHTPLHVSVLHGNAENTRKLLEAKADLSVSDQSGRTALHYAVNQNQLDLVEVIIEMAPNDINLVDTTGWSALHLACQMGFTDCIKHLVSCPSCDCNLKDLKGCTPLHIAAKCNNEEAVRTLLNCGANTTIRDTKDKTALHYCKEMGYASCGHIIQLMQNREHSRHHSAS